MRRTLKKSRRKDNISSDATKASAAVSTIPHSSPVQLDPDH